MIETISFQGKIYPKLQSEGYASQYCHPFAKKILKGKILDIGCMKKEWALEGAIPIDLSFDDNYDAMHLPEGLYDGIISSHMAEHFIGNVFEMFNYWRTCLKPNGVLFLYLPHYAYQEYWHSWSNKKHIHHFTPNILRDYFNAGGWTNIFVTDGADLNASFYAIAEKK